MLKLYIYPRLEGKADSKLLRLFLSDNEYEGKIFQTVETAPFKKMVKFVDEVEEADYILLPHEYYFVKQEDRYFTELNDFSAKAGKKVIVFDYGDVVDEVKVKNSIVLRTAAYRSRLKPNEIIIPPFIEDLGEQFGIDIVSVKPDKPSVGFVGMVNLPSWKQEVKFQIRILLHQIKILFGRKTKAMLQGLLFRRQSIKALNKTEECKTNFIIRNSFSAHEKTISKDPKILRQEYVDAIKDSDLNLIVRGDGNYSLRFFEVLSLGRIPLFVDTDTPLPLESDIPYDSFMIRVDHTEIISIGDAIKNYWSKMNNEEYKALQKTARNVFETKLRPDVFYTNLFAKLEAEARK